MSSNLMFRVAFPLVILVPMIFFYGRLLTRNDPWGEAAWLLVYLPFILCSLVSNWLVAKFFDRTTLLRTLLYYFSPYFLYGIFLGFVATLNSEAPGIDVLVNKVLSGAVTSSLVAYTVFLSAPYFLLALAVADYFAVSNRSLGWCESKP